MKRLIGILGMIGPEGTFIFEREVIKMMRLTVSRDDPNQEGKYVKLAEFYDAYNVSLFISRLICEAYETGKASIKIDVDFPEIKEV